MPSAGSSPPRPTDRNRSGRPRHACKPTRSWPSHQQSVMAPFYPPAVWPGAITPQYQGGRTNSQTRPNEACFIAVTSSTWLTRRQKRAALRRATAEAGGPNADVRSNGSRHRHREERFGANSTLCYRAHHPRTEASGSERKRTDLLLNKPRRFAGSPLYMSLSILQTRCGLSKGESKVFFGRMPFDRRQLGHSRRIHPRKLVRRTRMPRGQ